MTAELLALVGPIEMSDQLDRPNQNLSKFMDELQTDKRTMTSANRTEILQNMQIAEDQYDAESQRSMLGGFLGRMDRNKRTQDLAKIRLLIRNGVDPFKAVEQVIRSREQEFKKQQQSDQDRAMEELLK